MKQPPRRKARTWQRWVIVSELGPETMVRAESDSKSDKEYAQRCALLFGGRAVLATITVPAGRGKKE